MFVIFSSHSPENVPRLYDLVRPKDPSYRTVFYHALRDTLVADNLDQATRIGLKVHTVAHVTSPVAHVTSTVAHVTSPVAHVTSTVAHVTSTVAHVTSAVAHVASAVHTLAHVTSTVHTVAHMNTV